MPEDRTVTFTVPGIWQQLRDVRARIRTTLDGLGGEVQSAAEIAASELMENAIKYGAAVPALADIRVEVHHTSEALTIRVCNGVENLDHVTRLQNLLSELANGRDPLEAYVARLEELSRSRPERMGLGVYRIAAEGKFSISATLTDGVLAVTAQRPSRVGGYG